MISSKFPTWRWALLLGLPLQFSAPAWSGQVLRFQKHVIANGGDEACTFGDFNGDKKTDIACGNSWYQNPTWTSHPFPGGTDFLAAMDVDGDGLVDAISGNIDNASWYRNTGNGLTFAAGKDLGVGGQHSGSLWDVDGDGKAREIVSSQNGKRTAWSEVVNGNWVTHVIDSTLDCDWGSGVGDVNGDGRPDILRPNAWFEAPANIRTGKWIMHPAAFGAIEDMPTSATYSIRTDHPVWEWNNEIGKFGHTVQIYVQDVDGDGLNDVIASSGHRMGIMWYKQVKKNGVISFLPNIIDGSISEVHTLELADLDKDGDLDLVAGKRWRGHSAFDDPLSEDSLFVYWYEKIPTRPYWKRHVITYGENIGAGMKIGIEDYDNDGDLDIVVSAKNQEGKGGGPFLFENMYPATVAEADIPAGKILSFTKQKIDSATNFTCLFADINKDGKLDIVGGNKWYEAPNWIPHTFRTLADDGFADVMDVDGDGWVDVLTGSYSKGLSWWRNPGAVPSTAWVEKVIDPQGNYENGQLWDVDGDGKAAEIVTSSYGMPVLWWEVVAGVWTSHLVSNIVCNFGAGVGDVNGDGRPDIIRPNAWFEAPANPRTGVWIVHEIALGAIDDRPTAPNAMAPQWFTSNTVGRTGHTGQIYVYDVDKDGRNDIIAASAHGVGIFWYRQTATHTFERQTIDATWSQAHGLIFKDMDGDGDPDLVTGKCFKAQDVDPQVNNPLEVVWYELTPGKTNQWIKHEISYNEGIGSGFTLGLADIDGDKDMDLVVTGKFGGPWLFTNTTGSTSLRPQIGSKNSGAKTYFDKGWINLTGNAKAGRDISGKKRVNRVPVK